MKFLARALAWATLLALPCFLVSKPWQAFLAHAATAAMATIGFPWTLRSVNILAPCDIGIYLALVLASRTASPRTRVVAGVWGTAILFAIEVITAMLGALQVTLQQSSSPSRENQRALLRYVVDSALLWSPVVVWLILLGRHELREILATWRPAAAEGEGREARPRPGGSR